MVILRKRTTNNTNYETQHILLYAILITLTSTGFWEAHRHYANAADKEGIVMAAGDDETAGNRQNTAVDVEDRHCVEKTADNGGCDTVAYCSAVVVLADDIAAVPGGDAAVDTDFRGHHQNNYPLVLVPGPALEDSGGERTTSDKDWDGTQEEGMVSVAETETVDHRIVEEGAH